MTFDPLGRILNKTVKVDLKSKNKKEPTFQRVLEKWYCNECSEECSYAGMKKHQCE